MDLTYDSTGKVDLNDIYNRSDPSLYFSTLGTLGYCIPQNAKPIMQNLIDARRESTGQSNMTIVDIGCSYGINAALLKYDVSLGELYRHYLAIAEMPRSAMLEEDGRLFSEPADQNLHFVGIDTAHRALRYALDAGIVDSGTTANFEDTEDISELHRRLLRNADIVMSTGCYGYVTSKTLTRILDCCEDNSPWMLHAVLRVFDFSDAIEALGARGYVTQSIGTPLRQRRFASTSERDNALERLNERGVDVAGREASGWYYADVYLSRPFADARRVPVTQASQALN